MKSVAFEPFSGVYLPRFIIVAHLECVACCEPRIIFGKAPIILQCKACGCGRQQINSVHRSVESRTIPPMPRLAEFMADKRGYGM